MILPLLTWLTLGTAFRADTVIMMDSREMDMTGDGTPESIQLVAAGPTKDKLTVTFTILSMDNEVLYAEEIPAPGGVGQLGAEFFINMKFESPQEFLARLRDQFPERLMEVPRTVAKGTRTPDDLAAGARVWQEIEGRRGALVFTFPAGRNGATTIAWSQEDHRFYDLLE